MPFLENQEIAKRLETARGARTKRNFAMTAGVDPSQYNKIESGELPITEKILDKLVDAYGLRKEYILYGIDVPHETNLLEGPPQTYVQKRNSQKQTSNIYLVPFVDIPAQAGYRKAYGNVDYIHTLKTYPILPDIDPTGAVWRYFQVQGDSMEEEIKDKDVLLTSLVPQMDWPDIKDYYTHVIVTDEELLIKDILKESDDSVILLSQNPNYKARRLSLKDVRQIWVMRRHIKNRAKKTRMYNLDEIKKELNK